MSREARPAGGVAGTPSAEVAIDPGLVGDLLGEQHPELAALPIEAAEAGWDNAIFRLGERLAVRLPRRLAAAGLIENEQRWLPGLAERLPLPIPSPVRVGRPGCGYPWAWSVVPWLPGQAADQQPPRQDQAESLASFLEALHTEAPAGAPRNPVRGVPLAARADALEPRWTRLVRHAGDEIRELLAAVHETWKTALATPIDQPPTWIHGDLHARNVLVEDGALCGVIDWGDMARGDRATDLASIFMLLPGADARRQAMDRYRTSRATWRRAKGWAVLFGVVLLDTGLVDHPRHAAMGEKTLRRICAGP